MSKPKSILITGATGNLGMQFVRHFLSKGHTVVATSRSPLKLAGLYKTFKTNRKAKRLFGIAVDLETKNAPEEIAGFLRGHKIALDVLINNARNRDNLKIASGGPNWGQWLGEFFLDVVIPCELSFTLTQEFSSLKNIINISSAYGVVAAHPQLYKDPQKQSPIHYSVAKAALIHLTKELAVRLAPKGVRVNCISYGGVEGRADEAFKKRYAQYCPAGRMLKDKEVIGAAEFLVSEASIGMLGHNLVVDGGWSVW